MIHCKIDNKKAERNQILAARNFPPKSIRHSITREKAIELGTVESESDRASNNVVPSVMSYSRRPEYSRSPSPYKRYSSSRSVSRSISRSRSRSCDSTEVENPGNNLYVTGLSPRVTKRELEEHFSSEGTVVDVHLVVDPWTRDSRGFGFVTMSTIEEANRCIKHLDRSVLEGRVIMVEKARRKRGRTPTPGRYLGLRNIHGRGRSPSYSPHHRSRSPRSSSERDRSRSSSPYYSRHKSHHSRRSRSPSRLEYSSSPRSSRERSYSPVDRYYHRRDRSYSPYDRHYSRRDRSYSPYDRHYRRYDRSYSPEDRHYRSRRLRSVSRSFSPRARRSSRRYSPSISPLPRKNYSPSVSPRPKRSSRRSYSPTISPRRMRSSRKDNSYRGSSRRGYSRDSFSSGSPSRGRSVSASSRSVSRSVTPKSTPPPS